MSRFTTRKRCHGKRAPREKDRTRWDRSLLRQFLPLALKEWLFDKMKILCDATYGPTLLRSNIIFSFLNGHFDLSSTLTKLSYQP